jgi:hypothetical protein
MILEIGRPVGPGLTRGFSSKASQIGLGAFGQREEVSSRSLVDNLLEFAGRGLVQLAAESFFGSLPDFVLAPGMGSGPSQQAQANFQFAQFQEKLANALQ